MSAEPAVAVSRSQNPVQEASSREHRRRSPSSSDVVEHGFVTYSNEAKSELLWVPVETIDAHGVVSNETAGAMAEGAVARAPVDLAISVIGVAGPRGGAAKPVGIVIFGLARRDGPTRTELHVFDGDRAAVRQAALRVALGLVAAKAHN